MALDLGSTPGSEIASYAALMDAVDGRTAIVTSAASSIGLALASALAAAGSRVLMTDIDGTAVKAAATWVQANGGLVDSREVDVRDEDAVQQTAQRAFEQFGPLHVVVNNVNTENRDTRWKQPWMSCVTHSMSEVSSTESGGLYRTSSRVAGAMS